MSAANSRRQWFVLSPRSGDTAVLVLQDPSQPMVIRADLPPGPPSPLPFSPYEHTHLTVFRESASGGYCTVLCQPMQQSRAPRCGHASPRAVRAWRILHPSSSLDFVQMHPSSSPALSNFVHKTFDPLAKSVTFSRRNCSSQCVQLRPQTLGGLFRRQREWTASPLIIVSYNSIVTMSPSPGSQLLSFLFFFFLLRW